MHPPAVRRSAVRRPARLHPLRLAFALVVALLLASCNSAAPSGGTQAGGQGGGGKVRLGVGGQPLLAYLPATLAQQLGYYKEEGVEVQIEDLGSGSKALQSMLGGSTDVTSGFYDHTVQMAAKQQQVVAFANMLRYPALVVAVSPKAKKPINSIADLKGANVGVTAPGSSTDFFLKHLLVKNGLAADAAAPQAIGADATAVAAMEQGQVDAAVMLDPAFSQVEKRASGQVKVLADTRTAEGVQQAYGTATYPAAVLYAKQDWIKSNEDTTRKMARAMQRTLEFIQKSSPEEIAAKMPPQFAGEDRAVYLSGIAAMKASYNPTGELDQAGAQAVRDVLAQSQPEIKAANVDVSKTYTNEYLKK